MNVIIHIKKAAQTNLNSLQTSFAAAYTRISNNYQPFYCNLTKFVSPALQPKPQQIHHPEFFPALGAQIINILDTNILKHDIRQLRRGTDIHNINLRFLKFPETSLADFHVKHSPRKLCRQYLMDII